MSNSSVKKACREFIDADDTSPELIKDLKKLKSMKSNVGDRLAKVVKDLGVVRNIFKNHGAQRRAAEIREFLSSIDDLSSIDE